eukprot:3835385-Alexandrium_andersonii.AAC.1
MPHAARYPQNGSPRPCLGQAPQQCQQARLREQLLDLALSRHLKGHSQSSLSGPLAAPQTGRATSHLAASAQ